MFDLARTRIIDSQNLKVHSLYPVTAEGLALVHDMEGGEAVVRASSGTSNNEIFVGFSLAQNIAPTSDIKVEDLVVPANAPYTLKLQRTPTAATEMLVKVGSTVLTFNAAVGAGQFNLTGDTLTFNVAQASGAVHIVYEYNMSAVEAQMKFGDQPVGPTATSILGSVSVINKGYIFTNNFDKSDDYATAIDSTAVLKAGTNGRLQLGGTGAAVPGRIFHAPSADVPFLGVYINA